MRKYTVLLFTALITLTLLCLTSGAQEASNKRKLVEHAAPEYPTLARMNRLRGTVKVDVLIAPDGSVKNAALRGGSPILAQAALDAVRHWKWEAGARESREIVEVDFTP